jgi:hypothetical protein
MTMTSARAWLVFAVVCSGGIRRRLGLGLAPVGLQL